jgi:hypothetical protein
MQLRGQLLNSLIAKSPEYVWEEQAGLVHFYNKTILNAPAHPLNFKLKSFQLPANVSQLKIFLPARFTTHHKASRKGVLPSARFHPPSWKKKSFLAKYSMTLQDERFY